MDKKIALALSGGGYRASLFHAGALIRLAELGLLSKISKVTAVSGGAITAGIWADDLINHPAGTDTERAIRIRDKVLALTKHSIDSKSIIGGVLNPFKDVNEVLVGSYKKHLFNNNFALTKLPISPYFTFCATNLQSGRQVYLDRKGIYDYTIGQNTKVVSICEAVAASSAFPPFLSPMLIDVDSTAWTKSEFSSSRNFPTELLLTDGGAYDNLGLESIWDEKEFDFILVSDAGAPFKYNPKIKTDWLSQSNIALEIAIDQARSVRKRWLIEQFKEEKKKGAYWGISSQVENFKLDNAMKVDQKKSDALKNVPTRLAPFDSGVDLQLINWGYAISDTALKKWCGELVNPVTTSAKWPYPENSLS